MLFITASGNIARHRFSDIKNKADFVQPNGNVRHQPGRSTSEQTFQLVINSLSSFCSVKKANLIQIKDVFSS